MEECGVCREDKYSDKLTHRERSKRLSSCEVAVDTLRRIVRPETLVRLDGEAVLCYKCLGNLASFLTSDSKLNSLRGEIQWLASKSSLVDPSEQWLAATIDLRQCIVTELFSSQAS